MPNSEVKPERALKRAGVYQSTNLKDRERRILNVMRDLLADVGYEALKMSDVAKRAGVARATLYNAYGNKEHLALLAIEDSLEQIRATVEKKEPAEGLEAVLVRGEANTKQMLSVPEYTREMARLMFRADRNHPIVDTLFVSDRSRVIRDIEDAQKLGQLRDDFTAEQISDRIRAQSWGTILEWSLGTTTNEDLEVNSYLGLLLILHSVAKGSAKATLSKKLEALSASIR